MEVIVMRELNSVELGLVSGGHGVCSATNSAGVYGGAMEPDLGWLYVALVDATSYVIERVAKAL
jgi:hypothetical protein